MKRTKKQQLRIERLARDMVAWKGILVPDEAVARTGQWRTVGRVQYGNVQHPFRVVMNGWVVAEVPAGSLVCVDSRRISPGSPASCEVIRQGNGLVRVNLWSRACGYAGVSPSGEVRPVEVVNAKA